MSQNTLYQADISSENFQTKIYYGISKTKFKTRFSNHKKSFNHEKHKNGTQLSNELWNIKASKEEPVLVWKILGQYQPYNVNTKRCLLCLNEKLQIAIYRGNNMLNKRTEIISKCRHRTNTHWQVMIEWIETSDVKSRGIIEIFEACGSLIYCSCEAD